MTVREILTMLERLAPPSLAESWDNVGLLIGEASQQVTTVLLALDATPTVLEQARQHDAQLIITHHPLIFSGVKRLTEDGDTASLIRRLIREGRSLISMHTNLDAAPDGLNAYVAGLLGLHTLRPLLASDVRPLRKLVVYVPETHVDAVRNAICAAGAGQIGHYAECTFGAAGTGTFRPEEGTHPYIGATGTLERVPEIRLETVVPQAALSSVLAAMAASHPYEEVAYDLFTLEQPWPSAGLGRIGLLDSPQRAREVIALIADRLHTDRLSIIGDADREVRTVALCTGAGGDFSEHAFRAGADLYLTGEMKHHQALQARQHGMVVVDAGHYATERPAVDLLAEYLATHASGVTLIKAMETDPLWR